MDSMDCKPAYKDLDWRAYLRTIQKGLHSATASRTAAILESVPCWWGIGQISAGLRHHSGPKFRFDWFDGGAQFSNGSYGAWAKVTRPSASEVRSNPTFSLDTCSCSWIEKSPENGAMGLFSGRSQATLEHEARLFVKQIIRAIVRWEKSSLLIFPTSQVERAERRATWHIAWDVFHVSYTWQPRFLFGFCLLIFRSHFTLLANCAKSLTSTDSSIGSARAKNKRSKYNRDIGGFIFLILHNIWDVILPIDELMFFRGVGIPPSRRDIVMGLEMSSPVAMSIRIPRSVVKKDCEAMVHFVRWFTQLWFSRANCSIPNGYES